MLNVFLFFILLQLFISYWNPYPSYYILDLELQDYIEYQPPGNNTEITRYTITNNEPIIESKVQNIKKREIFNPYNSQNLSPLIINGDYDLADFIVFLVHPSIIPKNKNTLVENLEFSFPPSELFKKNLTLSSNLPIECVKFVSHPRYFLIAHQLQVTNIVQSNRHNFALDKHSKQIVIFEIYERQMINYLQLCSYISSSSCSFQFDKLMISHDYLIAYQNESTFIVCFEIDEKEENSFKVLRELKYELNEITSNIQGMYFYYNTHFVLIRDNQIIIYDVNQTSQFLTEKNRITHESKFVDSFLNKDILFGLTETTLFIININQLVNGETQLNYSFQVGRNCLKFDLVNEQMRILNFGILTQSELIELTYYLEQEITINRKIKFIGNLENSAHVATSKINNEIYSLIFTNHQTYLVKRNVPNYMLSYGAKLEDKAIFSKEIELYSVVSNDRRSSFLIISENESFLFSDIFFHSEIYCRFTQNGLYRIRNYEKKYYSNCEIGYISYYQNKESCFQIRETFYYVYDNEWRLIDTILVIPLGILFFVVLGFVIQNIHKCCKKKKENIKKNEKEENSVLQRKKTSNSENNTVQQVKEFTEKTEEDNNNKIVIDEK